MNELKHKLEKALKYFRDDSVPMHIRVGILIVLSMILTFPFWIKIGKDSRRNSRTITSDSFPRGFSGLAEDSRKEDLAKAALIEYEQKQQTSLEKAQLKKAELELEGKLEKTEQTTKKEILNKKTKLSSITSPFKAFPIYMLHPRAIKQGPENSIWVADKGGIYSFDKGKLSKGKLILNNDIYDKEFNSDLPPLTNIYPANDGSLWAGFNDGTLMRYHRYEWEHLRGKNKSSEDAITSFAESEDNLFIGSKALYQWEKEKLLSNPKFKERWVNAMLFDSKIGLLLASARTLYKYNNDKWEIFFKASKEDKSINVITKDKNSILLGTWSGIVRLSEKGVILDRMLSNENVKSISVTKNNTIWAGTRGSGLRYFDGDAWYKAKDQQGLGDWASEVFIDKNDIIWLGVTGSGLFLAKEDKAAKWISNYPDISKEVKPLIFKDACQAAQSLIDSVNFSNQVSTRKIDDKRYVFFKGNQICPKGAGYYRNDDSLAILDGWRLILFKDNKRTEIEIEKDYPADQIDLIYYDSSNSIWIHTDSTGLSRYKEQAWEHLELLKDNPVKAMAEDQEQRLWIATSPGYDKEIKKYKHKSLHIYSDSSWESYDSKNGLAQNSSHSIDISNQGLIAVGTRLGVSLVNQDKEVTNYGKNIDLDKMHIADLSFDKKERIWIAHQYLARGITWIDENKIYSLEKGLFNTKISKIALDRAGRVWLLASNGQTGVYPKSYLYKNASAKTFDKKALRSRKLDRKE